MRTLDLNAYGVYEMNDVEMRDVDGGLPWFVALGALVVGSAILTYVYGRKWGWW